MTRYPLLVLALAACTKADDTDAPVGPAYYGDVQPIVNAKCSRCHTDGGVAPISFDDPATVALSAAAIQAAVAAGTMPPPAPDPDCAPYEHADEWRLTDAERDTIAAWVDAGAPLGDAALAEAKPGPVTSAPFSRELYGGAAYTPSFDADGDDYRCFRLDVGNDAEVYLTGFEAIVDQAAEVHHVVIFRDPSRAASTSPDGFSCSGFGEDNWEYLGGWAPGAPPLLFPEGAGLKFQPDTSLVLQMHYNGRGTPTPDRSGFGLHLADSVTREVTVVPFGSTGFTIPAGEVYTASEETRWQTNYGRWQAIAVWPHMHQLGTGLELGIRRRDDSDVCLTRMNGWNFHNQLVAKLSTPVDLGPGDVVHASCTWDNREKAVNPKQFADPPQDVPWGEGSYDEMCFAFTYLVKP